MSDDDECFVIDDNINYKSITCEKIPELFLDKLIAKKHFGKYGKINRFILRPNRLCCTVDYEREEEAAKALKLGNIFHGQEFDIRYSQRDVTHVQNTEEWVDPDVQAELDVMGNHTRRPPMSVSKLPPSAPRVVKQKFPKPVSETPNPQTVPKVPSAIRAELEAILRKPAYNDEDKYRILDARDKLIRLTTVRTTDINKAVSIKGTCPDMCPEKERFMREFQHQVSNFEMEEGGNRSEMNHNIAVKEYSRSSADQEVPLAHELRPEPVLKMTMLYLMHRVMGLCDIPGINISDWFHFVWDRTRSIRKDITQQELCSLGAVELVEQCARFHIHCAARLVAEDPSVFDQKINTENLTKCLQTLKYMYNDLRIKGVRCNNEAQFRGFIVLLNLNDANFLWELQQLPEEIQNSKEVRSATAFYKCLESNNYVRFFKLVEQTTYMNACILLRYFTQVRLKALRMIIKAYNWPRHLVSLPLAYLIKILGFENEDAALDFFSYYGLECDNERVCLDKNAFEEPDVPVSMDRAFEIVESKCQVGVGEAICGYPLESAAIFENHRPHNSFDANGYLRFESFTAEDQLKGENSRDTTPNTISDKIFKVPSASPPANAKQKLKALFTSSSTKADTEFKSPPTFGSFPISESIFSQKPTPPTTSSAFTSIFKVPSPAPPVQEPAKATSIFSNSVFQNSSGSSANIFGGAINDSKPTTIDSIFGASTKSFAKDNIFQHFNSKPLEFNLVQPVPSELHREDMLKIEKEQKQREEAQRQKLLEEEATKQREMKELELQRKIAEDKIRQERLKAEQKKSALNKIQKKSEQFFNALLKEVLFENINEIGSRELKIHQRLEKLKEELINEYITEFIRKVHSSELKIIRRDQSLLCKYFNIWRELAHKQKTHRELIGTMPIWMTTDTLNEHAQKIAHPRQMENLQMIKRYRLGFPCDFKALLDDEELNVQINMFGELLKHLKENQNQLPTGFLKRRKYFKMIMSLPGEREELPGFNSYLNNWLEKHVERKCVESTPAFLCHCEDELGLCVRKISCVVPKNEENQKVNKECDHADALLFFMSPGNSLNSRKRLHHLLKLSRINRAVPIVILVYHASRRGNIEAELDLESLVDDGKISSFRVLYSNDCEMREDLQKALRFLAKDQNYSCPLEAQCVLGFLDSCLGDILWQRLYKSWTTNPSFRKICSTPKYIISIYNEGIDRLLDVIDEDFQDYPEFPEELRQFVPKQHLNIPVGLENFPNDWKNVDRTKKMIDFLNKLKLAIPKVDTPLDIDDLELWILNYTSACIPNNDDLATKAGYNAIKCLIDELNSSSLEDMSLDKKFSWISWLPIIRQVALAVANHQWIDRSSKLPRDIIYNREELFEYLSEPWWLQSEAVNKVKMMTDTEENEETEEIMNEDINDVIARAEKASLLADDKLRKLQIEAASTTANPELTKELDEALYNFEVNEKCRSFECNAATVFIEQDDSLDEPPLAKKFKENPEKAEIEETMERAFAILKKAEGIMDYYKKPITQILDDDYL